MEVDAIVNAANPRPIIGYGVDSGVHKKAGDQLLAARKKIGDIAFGEAAITPAFNLSAKYIIHAVSPIWQDGKKNEAQLLENCYVNSLQLALEHKCESIAFPLLSAGNHGFPKDLALQTAINVFSKFLMKHEMQIFLVVLANSLLRYPRSCSTLFRATSTRPTYRKRVLKNTVKPTNAMCVSWSFCSSVRRCLVVEKQNWSTISLLMKFVRKAPSMRHLLRLQLPASLKI